MIKEKKEHSRSIRMTNTVKEYVEKQPGDGFNEKFENMVLFCKVNKPQIEKEIKEKEKRLKELNTKIANMQSIVNEIENMKWNIENVINRAKKIADTEI